jgi:hypothetical protein
MSFGTGPGQSPLGYVGTKETNPPQVYKISRAPTTADFRGYNLGDIWIDTSVPEPYMCSRISGAVGTWQLMVGAGGDFNSITADTGSTTGPTIGFTGNNGLEANIVGTQLTYQFTPVSAGFTGSQREFKQAALSTTDATPTFIFELGLNTNEAVSLNCRITGFRDDFTSALVGEVFYGARTAGGNAIEIGPPVINILEDNAASPSIDAEVNSTNMRVTVTGVAGQNWNWVASYDYHAVQTNL